MQKTTNIILTLIIVYVFSFIVNIFVTNRGVGRLTRIAINFTMIVLCLINFNKNKYLSQFNFKISKNFNDNAEKLGNSEALLRQIEIVAKTKIERNIFQLLENKGILPNKVDISLDTDDRSDISIKEIRIYIGKILNNRKNFIENYLGNILKIDVEKIKVCDEFGNFQ